MNILIVDDAPSKRELLQKFLHSLGGTSWRIDLTTCAREARDAVNSRTYDLLLIDLVLPASSKGEPRADVGFELLQEFVEDGRASRIVGVTSNLEALDDYANEFRQLAEMLLLVDGVDEEWRESLKSVVLQIRSRAERPNNYNLDFCFLTAVRNTEYKAVLELPLNWGAEKVLSNGGLYREGSFEVDGTTLNGLVANARQMGMVAATHLCQSIIMEFRPRVILMTGICGGLPGETNLGDLIVADKSWDWQSGKHTANNGFASAPDQKDASPNLVALAKSLDSDLLDVTRELVGSTMPSTTPRIIDGPMLTGSAVVASDQLHSIFVAQHRKPVAIDMECYGVYYACRLAGTPEPEFICLKSVSDQSDAHKGDIYQAFCSSFSAKMGLRLLTGYFGPT